MTAMTSPKGIGRQVSATIERQADPDRYSLYLTDPEDGYCREVTPVQEGVAKPTRPTADTPPIRQHEFPGKWSDS